MVAKLIAVSLMTRVVVPENATDEEIMSVALPKFQKKLETEALENVEFIELDEECPFGSIDEDKNHNN